MTVNLSTTHDITLRDEQGDIAARPLYGRSVTLDAAVQLWTKGHLPRHCDRSVWWGSFLIAPAPDGRKPADRDTEIVG
jgi:hypothetical protein